MSRRSTSIRLGAVHPFSSDLPGEKWYERERVAGKVIFETQSTHKMLAGYRRLR